MTGRQVAPGTPRVGSPLSEQGLRPIVPSYPSSQRGGFGLRRLIIGAALFGLVGFVGGTSASGSTGPTCFGKPATVAGSGIVGGTSGNDVIVGSASDDTIEGKGGNDLICGLDGSDVIQGGLGNDQVDAGAGDDEVAGDVSAGGSQAPGPDTGVTGDATGGGNDTLYGGDGSDIMSGDSFSPHGAAAGGGNDQLFGGAGVDRMAG